MTGVVFSKDRALQLHAFLRSCKEQAPHLRVHVLYASSSPRHDFAYDEVLGGQPWAVKHRQTISFKMDLVDILRDEEGSVVFFVDDQVFTQPWDTLGPVGLSLRMGRNLTHCYPTDTPQPLPQFTTFGADMLSWKWADGVGDWGYPMSLDGHVFDLFALRRWLEMTAFVSPNTLEATLQSYTPRPVDGFCYRESKVVNIPWNRVQVDYDNRYAWSSVPFTDVEQMLKYWENGQQIDVAALYGMVNVSAHQEIPLRLEPREVSDAA